MTKNTKKYMAAQRAETLHEVSGEVTRKSPEITLRNSTLMIINAQNEYLDGTLAIPGIAPAVTEISNLLTRARNNETPIMYLQHVDGPGGLFNAVDHGGRFIDIIAPDNNEYIVQKTMPNGFAVTNLNEQLSRFGRTNLIIAGFMTHMCVSFTTRAAVQLGYQPCVVAKACAASALPSSGVNRGDDRQRHQRALAHLAGCAINVVNKSPDIPD